MNKQHAELAGSDIPGWVLHEAPRRGRALLPAALRASTDRSDRGGTGATASTFNSPQKREAAAGLYPHTQNFFSVTGFEEEGGRDLRAAFTHGGVALSRHAV